MVFIILYNKMSQTKNIILIRADDADVFVLMLHHIRNMSRNTTLLKDMGLTGKNNRRCIKLSELSVFRGPEVGIHANNVSTRCILHSYVLSL